MKDKKSEADIKLVKEFLELWSKFHSIYSQTVSKGTISKDDEAKFLDTKNLIKDRYETLRGALEFTYMPQARVTDPVSEILALDRILVISERVLKKAEEDWRDSYVFLNSILERLKNKRRRLEQANPLAVFAKRVFGWRR